VLSKLIKAFQLGSFSGYTLRLGRSVFGVVNYGPKLSCRNDCNASEEMVRKSGQD